MNRKKKITDRNKILEEEMKKNLNGSLDDIPKHMDTRNK